jgi:uncharacterized iron-regulated protein
MKILIFVALVVSIFFLYAVAAAENLPLYNLSVSFDIKQNLIKGISTISFSENREINISIGNLKITSIRLNGSPLKPEIKEGMLKVKDKGTLEIIYEGIFKEESGQGNLENIGIVSKNVISEEGIYLTGGWYPSIVGIDSYREGMAYYSLKALIPASFIAISEADEISVADTARGKEYSFKFPHPLNEINLVAGRYTEKKETFNGIDIHGYFFTEDISLAKIYIKHTKKYLKMYEDILGPYPYKRFSVIENFLPTGYSMPTFTLLGQDVVRLPFIVDTSLGHEVLHQWFGNFVYCECNKGNWIEGLTTYLSDHLFEEQNGKGWQYRKKLLIDYQTYVTPDKETGLKDFLQRTDFSSKAIGYGKGAMIFHMLKNLIGDDAFFTALKGLVKEKEFQVASWDDVRMAFEKASGKNLGWFFSQWLTRKGVISIDIRNPRVVVLKGIPTVSFKIIQKGEPYKFNLTLKIKTDKGEIAEILNIENEKETFEIPAEGTPLEVIFDGGYDLMRRLSKEEYPPVIAKLLGDERRLIVVPEKDRERYDDLINVFKKEGFTTKEEKEVKDEDIKTASLIVLGFDNPILKRLFGKFIGDPLWRERPEPGFTLIIKENPPNTSKVIAIAYGDSKEEVDLVSKKIFHYGKYSLIRFEKGKNIEKKTDETKQGIRVSLYEPVLGVQPQNTIKLDEIINNILDKPIIYVGERHTNYEEHKVQLKVITSFYEKGRKFAIGMEMFQQPFQKAINDYISGAISDKDFLKATQYFKRWQFAYNLYREIIEFAKAKKIPVVALNLRAELIEKVSKGGLDALTGEERKEIPEDMNMSDEDYKNRLWEIFKQHEKSESKNFDYFYQSQILWDETMAHSVNKFLKENPDYQMVILAGVGHIMYGSGIPKRVYRLNEKDYATLIPDIGNLDDDIANFVLFPEHILSPPTLKLGVFLKEMDGRVKIEEIQPDSIAENAGLKKDDILISIDDCKVEAVEDVKISMFDKQQGDSIKIKILRKRFLLGDKVLEFTVAL